MEIKDKIEDLYVVPEEIVRKCAEDLITDPSNNFLYLLENHKIFKDAGLTPIFLTKDMVEITITTVEKIRKLLH